MADPLGSPMWETLAARFFAGAPARFTPDVRVLMPEIAENQHVFPVMIDARAVPGASRLLLFADLNPIPLSIDHAIGPALPLLATCIKLDQRTPVRGAVLANGTWHVGGQWIDAAGGGCSAPPLSRVRGDWADHLGELRGAAWPDPAGVRLRLAIRHPMDTGLVENIAAYHLARLAVKDAAGRTLASLTIGASVAEDPVFTLLVPGAPGDRLSIEGEDSGGVRIAGTIDVPRLSPFPAAT